MVVEGIQVLVSGKEIISHLNDRVAYHAGRGTAYAAQISSLGETAPEMSQQSMSSSIAMSAIAELRGKVASHSSKAKAFQFLVEHLNPDETYDLDSQELNQLEFINGTYW